MTVPEEMAADAANKKAEREALRGVIQQWNANRLDLFELSEPNEDLEFHGVMRFYFQDSGQKVATKCIRVASDATSQAVIETLIEKFRPDMRMLSVPEYALYEIHENGEERKLGLEEKPLLVQLNWHIDDREGRFLLRRIDDKTNAQGVGFGEGTSFRRKLSKREKKQMKKQEKLSRLKSAEQDENSIPVDQNGVAEKLYTELPETSFTRSISNPEAVMRRRRQQKLERKLQQFRSKDGGPDTGGTLKIYGEALCKDVPYKTLLLSVRDSAAQVVREMLAKYGLDKVDPQQYCLVQVNGENLSGNIHQEYILDDDECPLAILMNHPSTRGSIMFHVRRRPADYVPRKRKKKPTGKWNEPDHRYEDERLPFLLELNPDGTEIPNGAGIRHRLQPNVTEVGSERPIGTQAVQAQTLTLSGPTVMPRHCVIAFTENIVTLTPCSRDAHTYVNNQRIHQTTILQNGAIIKFGRMHTFRFIDPAPDDRIRQRHDSNRQIEYNYDRRSPDANSQDVNSEKYRPDSGELNDGQNSSPPSPTKSQAAASPRSTSHNVHPNSEGTHNYETTFDLDGNVETASLTSSRDGNRLSQQYDRQPRGTDPILPAVLEFLEETEETFLHAVISDVEPSTPQFKLAPTYTLYLAARYRASTHYRPELQPTERAHKLTVMLANVATMIQRVIQERYMDASSLALWLANGSELLHMLKSDRHVGAFSTRAQDILADAVQTAFASLVRCVSLELAPAMSQFMADADEPAKEAGVLQIFSNTMVLLRRCRVNAALTIQLFSHLFHTINATAFNSLVSNGNLCVRWFGRRLKARLNALETWAERQGLELASQCHLATIMQATHLLQAPKYNAEELATLSSTCFKLNSLQVRALLQKYQPAADEPRLPAELIENVVRVAESVADALARADGREIRLEEEPTLNLALLLPEDGYSCEVIRGVPPGLAEFLAPLQRDGLCRMAPQPTSSGYWTIYMIDHHNNFRSPSAMSNRSGGGYSNHMGQNHHGQPEIQIIKLHKSTNGMGLSIVAAKGNGHEKLGIYIKSVVAGGAADADGRLTAGDQLLRVDGQSLVGITQEKAAEYLVRTGPIVTLEVAKQGAIYHGLATLLSQPSPVMTRAHKSRPKSEQLEIPRDMAQPSTSHSVGNLLSVPKQLGFDRLLNNWDNNYPSGGTISHHLTTSKSSCFNNYYDSSSTRPYDYQSSSSSNQQPHHHHHHITSQSKLQNPSNFNNSCLVMYPINESPFDEDLLRSKNPNSCWIDKRSIPMIQEPNQRFLTIPQYFDQYPIKSNYTTSESVDSCQCEGHYSTHNSTVPSNLCKNSTDEDDDGSSSIYNESSIPFIDQTDENYSHKQNELKNMTETYSQVELNCSNSVNSTADENLTQVNHCFCHTDQVNSEEPSYCNQKNVINVDVEIVNSKFNDLDVNVDESEAKSEISNVPTPKMHTVMPELNLDLSGLNSSDVSSEDSNGEKCWKSPEEIRLGCGRVAALAKHFSKLGEAGLIKFKSIKLSSSRQFVSEPDMVSPRSLNATNYRKASQKEFKSETDLLKVDKSVATTPERQWSTILLDIQATNEIEMERYFVPVPNEFGNEKESSDDFKEGELKKSSSKLSLAEQQEIIEQLEEFSNLDNVDAPLYIPNYDNEDDKNDNGDGKTKEKGSNENLNDQSKLNFIEIPKYNSTINGKIQMECFRQHSLPTISSTFNITNSSSLINVNNLSDKMNKLEKYWSLKDLIGNDDTKSLSQNDMDYVHNTTSKYEFTYSNSKFTSVPDILNQNTHIFYLPTLDSDKYSSVGNITIQSKISISDDDSKSKESDETVRHLDRGSSPINLEPEKRLKFPNSFIKTRRMSQSDEVLNKNNDNEMKKKKSFKSLEKIPITLSELKSFSSNVNQCKSVENVDDCDDDRYCLQEEKPVLKKSLVKKLSKSDVDISERKPTPRFERGDWIFCDFPTLEANSKSRPRGMSERDLPSRLGHETATQQIHTSKSVPALHNVGTDGKQMMGHPQQQQQQQHQQQQHEVFNPGYSRASSSNSVTPPVQPPPMPAINGATALRSRSSHNLHDPMRNLPPSGLVSRQQSSPNLNPGQMHGNVAPNMQNNEAERFYQNLNVYRHQDPMMKPQPSPPQPADDRSPLYNQKNLRGSQNSLNRPTMDINQGRDRPISAYIPQGQQSNYNQMQQGPPRSQSSRDIIRQEAKLQEMQEEVRRRELRGGVPVINHNQYRPNTYNARPVLTAAQAANAIRPPRPTGSTPNLAPNSTNYNSRQVASTYGYPEQYNQYGQQLPNKQIPNYAVIPKKNERQNDLARDYGSDAHRTVMEHNRQFIQNDSQYPTDPMDPNKNDQYHNDVVNRPYNGNDINEILSSRPMLPDEEYRASPPPPPLNTSTHPLYNKHSDSRYTATMQDPPKSSHYPSNVPQQSRQYQYATNPWQREEREKEQAKRREAARIWRDQQIAELSGLSHRSPQQEEQLRALQLERDFQKRAEEAAAQQDDDDESNDLETESAQRVQGLLRMAATQERNVPMNHQSNTLSRNNSNNQSIRGAIPTVVNSQMQSPNLQSNNNQQRSAAGNLYMGHQNDSPNAHLQQMTNSSVVGQQHLHHQQQPLSPNYNTNIIEQLTKNMKTNNQIQSNQEEQRRIEEYNKRKQCEFDERKRDEELLRQQHQQQMHHLYQQHQSNIKNQQQQMHPGMLRLDNLIINEPASPSLSLNGNDTAPPPPERGSSYAVMSQQSVLRSNTSTTSNTPIGSHQTPTSTIKRVSFHDANANETIPRNTTSSSAMDTIREDPNNFINDAETLLASPITPEGPGGQFAGTTPGVIGAQEVYKDPRQKRLAEKQKQQQNSQLGEVPEKLSFKEKMKMFAMETGEDGTPRDKVKISRAQREIDNIGGPLNSTNLNNINNNNNNVKS